MIARLVTRLSWQVILVLALCSAGASPRASTLGLEQGEDIVPETARFTGTGFAFDLPVYHVGFELITEGTTNYTISRKMRTIFPFDLDLTVFIAWGYTGDKLSIRVQDSGDGGDRIFGIALASTQDKVMPKWGTLYSSGAQNSFEIIIPMSPPGAIIYFLSGFFTPSKGADAYSYTLTVSFPQ